MLVRRLLLCAVVIGMFAVPASATISYYPDSTSFLGAFTGMTEQDLSFDALTGISGTAVSLLGVTFTGHDTTVFPNPGAELQVIINPGSFPAVATGPSVVHALNVLRMTQGTSGY